MSESELPTMFTVKRDEHYCEPFGENWDAVLSRLTENQINFVGNEYGHLRHQINENYAELTSLRAELERVKAENEWHKYIDGDTSTYPNNDGLIFQIIYGVDGNEWEGHAFYGFVHGWSTDKNVLWYRSVPNTPTAPEEG